MKQLLLKMLPGLLPLFVFIAADEIWGTVVGLWVAIIIGITELLFIFIKEKRFDKFILFDTLLLVGLGGVSLLFDNDVFFKLKPAVIGVIICALLGVSAFTPHNFVFSMSKRYMKDIQLSDNQYHQFNRSLKVMFFIFLIHTLLVFYSVWFMSKEAWAFISGGLFYILMGIYFLIEFVAKFIKNKKISNEEWLPIVDDNGQVKGKAPRSVCHNDKSLMHPVVHLHVFNKKGELFLQKRPDNKHIQPGKWDTAVGGHVSFGETIEDALLRETKEEIGISNFTPLLIAKYRWESDIETELIFCFKTIYTENIIPDKNELNGGKFWKIKDIKKNMGKNIFTPNFEVEFLNILN
jgi:isopentenyldiphosphate isomerase